MNEVENIFEYLSPNEKKILPFIESGYEKIIEKSGLDEVSVMRSLEYLANKKIIELKVDKRKNIDLGVNGIRYVKVGLPERRLLNFLNDNKNKILSLEEIEKQSKLSDDEFKAALGALKKKAMIELKNGKIILNSGGNDAAKKMLEEAFIESLPLYYDELAPEQKHSYDLLKNRKEIVTIDEKREIKIELTSLGRKLSKSDKSNDKSEYIEVLTPELIKNDSWKGKKFRKYDVSVNVPKIFCGKRHFVNQSIDYGRKIWTEMGFKEMEGNIVQSSFWNFDALFTAQDHPVREMQDTFFLKYESKLPDRKLINNVVKFHESGDKNSKGWRYKWNEDESKKSVLRTHTTVLSALTLEKMSREKRNTDFSEKYFAIGKCFRNETVDWSHGFEFNQTEGIVVDKNVNFRHLLGYLNQFFKKMGYEKVRFRPAYFPYTEPSVEIDVFHPEKKVWLELGGAGIFRPEVTIPFFGEHIPVLAWGPGFDRILMDYYQIKDLRQLYKNDLKQLREMKRWMK